MPAATSPKEEEEEDDTALDPLAAAKKMKQLARKGIAFSAKESAKVSNGAPCHAGWGMLASALSSQLPTCSAANMVRWG